MTTTLATKRSPAELCAPEPTAEQEALALAVRAIARKYLRPGQLLSEELIAERRVSAAHD